jgi:hypothetical protein
MDALIVWSADQIIVSFMKGESTFQRFSAGVSVSAIRGVVVGIFVHLGILLTFNGVTEKQSQWMSDGQQLSKGM